MMQQLEMGEGGKFKVLHVSVKNQSGIGCDLFRSQVVGWVRVRGLYLTV